MIKELHTPRFMVPATAIALSLAIAGAIAPDGHAATRKHTKIEKVCKTKEVPNGTFTRCTFMAGTFLKKMVTTSERTYVGTTADQNGRVTVDTLTAEHLRRYNRAGKVVLRHNESTFSRKHVKASEVPPIKVVVIPSENPGVQIDPSQPEKPLPPLTLTPADIAGSNDLTGICYDGPTGDEVSCSPDIERAELDCYMNSTEDSQMIWFNPTTSKPNGQCLPFDPSMLDGQL